MNRDRNMFDCLVADDEPHIRDRIARLAVAAGLRVVGVAANGTEALAIIVKNQPDIAFLDIRMPGLSGLELVEVLARMTRPPVVVFVTAYSEHALAAFELSAIDYVLKPVETARFQVAVERAKATAWALQAQKVLGRLKGVLGTNRPERLTLRSGTKLVSVSPADVIRFQSADDYVEAFLGASSHLLSVTMDALEGALASPFVRVHRCHIVNSDHIRTHATTEGQMVLEMADASKIPVSRTRKARVRALWLNRMGLSEAAAEYQVTVKDDGTR